MRCGDGSTGGNGNYQRRNQRHFLASSAIGRSRGDVYTLAKTVRVAEAEIPDESQGYEAPYPLVNTLAATLVKAQGETFCDPMAILRPRPYSTSWLTL